MATRPFPPVRSALAPVVPCCADATLRPALLCRRHATLRFSSADATLGSALLVLRLAMLCHADAALRRAMPHLRASPGQRYPHVHLRPLLQLIGEAPKGAVAELPQALQGPVGEQLMQHLLIEFAVGKQA